MVTLSLPGGVNLYAFSLMLALGVASGLIWVAWRAPDGQALAWMDGGLVTLFVALLAARVGFLLLHVEYYLSHPLEGLNIFEGGFSGVGALLGGFAGLWWYARRRNLPFDAYADGMSPLLISMVIGILGGCWLHGCLFAPPGWGWPSPDAWGVIESRPPIQIIAALLILIGYYGIERLATRRTLPAGHEARLSLMNVSLVLLILSLFSADASPRLGGLALNTWAYLLFTVGCVLSLILHRRYS